MSTVSLAPRRSVLVDRVLPRSLAIDLGLIVVGAAFVAGMTQLEIPLWPVPITGQTFAVLLVGTTFGALRGALSLALYAVVGILGVPVFSDHHSGSLFALPTGGYVLGFIAAAALTGWLAQRAMDRSLVSTALTFLAGTAVMYAFGLPWLYASLNAFGATVWHGALGYNSVASATLFTGVVPFIPGDILKAILAGLLLPLAWNGIKRADAKKRLPAA
jgi:biotin transport system substrate-specific component